MMRRCLWAAGELDPALADERVPAVRQGFDEIQDRGPPAGIRERCVVCRRIGEREILPDGEIEQNAFLPRHYKRPEQAAPVDAVDVSAGKADRTRGRALHSDHELCHRRLAAAASTHDRGHGALQCRSGYVVEYRFVGVIREAHVMKLERAGHSHDRP